MMILQIILMIIIKENKYPESDHLIQLNDKVCILDYNFCDDNWTDYDELMKLAEPNNIRLMQKVNEVIDNIKETK